MATTNENLPPKVVRELAKELKSLTDTPAEGIRVTVSEDDLACIQAEIDGPVGTPYEGGLFRMKLIIPSDFPSAPPKGYFLTRIFHPNIAKNGEICVNVLKKDWKPSLGVRHVLTVVRCLLIEPYPESALNEEAGRMLMEDYDGYARHAKLLTTIHATKTSRRVVTSTLSTASSLVQNPSAVITVKAQSLCSDVATTDGSMQVTQQVHHVIEPHSTRKAKGEEDRVVEKRKAADKQKKGLRRL